jgi:hypothetical protein
MQVPKDAIGRIESRSFDKNLTIFVFDRVWRGFGVLNEICFVSQFDKENGSRGAPNKVEQGEGAK